MQVADLHRAAASSKPHFDISAIDIFTMQGCYGLLCFTTISLSVCVCAVGGVCVQWEGGVWKKGEWKVQEIGK